MEVMVTAAIAVIVAEGTVVVTAAEVMAAVAIETGRLRARMKASQFGGLPSKTFHSFLQIIQGVRCSPAESL
jgi:hypothetical protein